MSLGAVGAFLVVLVAVFVFGRLWFHLVESLLRLVRRLFTRHKDPPAWHPLSPEQKETHDD